MKIIFLIPPSEGKNKENIYFKEKLSFNLNKPYNIAINATEKDLKCKGNRYKEGIKLNKAILNKDIKNNLFNNAILRYSGVMYNAINYMNMSEFGKENFKENFYILSGFYGILGINDRIANYKLPIETKGLYDFWNCNIIEEINNMGVDYVVNLLPISYSKMLLGKTKKLEKEFKKLRKFNIINIDFIKQDGNKMSHGVKKVKGEFIYDLCENNKNIIKSSIFKELDLKNFHSKYITYCDKLEKVNVDME